jgi:S1-C subfamily serine protease
MVFMLRKSVQIAMWLTGLVILVTVTVGATARAKQPAIDVTCTVENIELEPEQIPASRNFPGLTVADLQGVFVSDVDPGSIAGLVGIHRGDVIVAVNGEPVRNVEEFRKLTSHLGAGLPVSFMVKQHGQINVVTIGTH